VRGRRAIDVARSTSRDARWETKGMRARARARDGGARARARGRRFGKGDGIRARARAMANGRTTVRANERSAERMGAVEVWREETRGRVSWFPFRRTARLDVAFAYLAATAAVLVRQSHVADGGERVESWDVIESGMYTAATALWTSRVAFDEVERRGLAYLAKRDGDGQSDGNGGDSSQWRVVIRLVRAGDAFFVSAFLAAASAVAFDIESIGRVLEMEEANALLSSKVLTHRYLVYVPGIIVASLGTLNSALSFIATEQAAHADIGAVGAEDALNSMDDEDGALFVTTPCALENHYASDSCDEYVPTCEAATLRDQQRFVRAIQGLRSFQAPINAVASTACLATAIGDKFEVKYGAVNEAFAACVSAIPPSFPAWLFLSANMAWIVELLIEQRMRCKLPRPSLQTSIERVASFFIRPE